jgi:hypothetical protein
MVDSKNPTIPGIGKIQVSIIVFQSLVLGKWLDFLPEVKSAIRIDSKALTDTFPSKIVQRRRFPRFRIG